MRYLRLAYYFVEACLYIRRVNRALAEGGFKKASERFLVDWKPNSRDWPSNDLKIREIGWAVEEACRWQLRTTDCLHRAIVAYSILHKLGARPQFVMGTRSQPFASHAWVELDGVAIADVEMRANRKHFVPLMRVPEFARGD